MNTSLVESRVPRKMLFPHHQEPHIIPCHHRRCATDPSIMLVDMDADFGVEIGDADETSSFESVLDECVTTIDEDDGKSPSKLSPQQSLNETLKTNGKKSMSFSLIRRPVSTPHHARSLSLTMIPIATEDFPSLQSIFDFPKKPKSTFESEESMMTTPPSLRPTPPSQSSTSSNSRIQETSTTATNPTSSRDAPAPACDLIASKQSSSQSPSIHEEGDALSDLLAAISKCQWQTAMRLLEKEPSLAKRNVPMVVQSENSTGLIVHMLAGFGSVPVAVFDLLVTLHPSSLLQPERRVGRLPIHIAVVQDAHPEVIHYLCKAQPQALRVKDHEGNLPLHYASMHGTPAIIRSLLETYPEACAVANTRDRFPIHLICARCYDTVPVPTQDLERLIQAYPAALTLVDRFGRTPMHLAANVQHPQWQVLQTLIAYSPEALTMKDKARKTPLQCAKRSHIGLKLENDLIVSSMLEATKKQRRRSMGGVPRSGSSFFSWNVRSSRRRNSTSNSSNNTRNDDNDNNSRSNKSIKSLQSRDDCDDQSLSSKDFYCCYG